MYWGGICKGGNMWHHVATRTCMPRHPHSNAGLNSGDPARGGKPALGGFSIIYIFEWFISIGTVIFGYLPVSGTYKPRLAES